MSVGGVAPHGRRYEFDAGNAAAQLQQMGGFSMQRTTGRSPARKGFMVADYGSEHVVPGYASPSDIETYRQSHANPSRDLRYVGGWHEGGQTFLDQSRRVMTARTAHGLGQANAQRAVYNLRTQRSPRVHYGGPVDVRGTLFQGHGEATQQLRTGNSDAMRQQREMELRLTSAGASAGRASAHRPQGRQLQLRGMRGY